MSVGTGSRRGGGHPADGMVVGLGMELGEAGPGVEERAAAADAVCELVDAVTPRTWNASAVEDAVDAIDMLAEALAAIDPEAARALATVPAATAELRRRLARPLPRTSPRCPRRAPDGNADAARTRLEGRTDDRLRARRPHQARSGGV